MKRALCIWLPHWPLQRLAVARAELKEHAVVLYRLHATQGARVVASCPRLATAAAAPWQEQASRAGIRAGMPLAEATALATAGAPHSNCLHLEVADPPADRLAFEELAFWCGRFSPMVGIEEAAEPESLLLDVTGLGRLSGGEPRYARTIVDEFYQRGFTVRVALADTLSAAWALAHFAPLEPGGTAQNDALDTEAILTLAREPLVVREGRTWEAIASLPVEALRLPMETCALLADLGLQRIEQVAALERATLLARFGEALLTQLDRARGVAAEVIAACQAPPEWKFEWLLTHPTSRREMIEFALDAILSQACQALAREGLGMLRLACRFEHESGEPDELMVGMYRPSASPKHVSELVHLKLERLRFREPVSAVSATVFAHDRLEVFQQGLFQDASVTPADQDARPLAALVDRLSNRLGPAAVVRPWILADAQPEFTCQYQPLCHLETRHLETRHLGARRQGRAARRAGKRARTGFKTVGDCPNFLVPGEENGTVPLSQTGFETSSSKVAANPGAAFDSAAFDVADRPLHLEPGPRPLEVISVAPEGPPMKFRLAGQDERVVRVGGPERIETGWWRARLVRRDYYQVETARGTRYWLFRELASGAWFLHGEFA